MHIALLSEHGEPLIGGATHLTRKIAESLSKQGHKISFIVPNSDSSKTEIIPVTETFIVIKVKAVVPIDDRSKFKGSRRRDYAVFVSEYLKDLHKSDPISIIQILSGMYLMRHLDVPYFRENGIKVIAGLLNVPPEECGLSWKGDNALAYLKDTIRKVMIGVINRARIRHHRYDAYTVESEHVKMALSVIVEPSLIHYIPLGTDENEVKLEGKESNSVKRILTVGGINPSKNQHVIPRIARMLLDRGIKFKWNIIGPDRNHRYTKFLKSEIIKYDVGSVVQLTPGMSKDQLMQFYEQSDIYVQTSIEEGFCMTALDAVIYGLPLVGISTGAIAEFIEKGKGILVKNKPAEFADAIFKIVNNSKEFHYSKESIIPVLEFYNWDRIAASYHQLYSVLLKGQEVAPKQATNKSVSNS